MSILAWIEDQRKLKLLNTPKYNNPASDGSQGLWTRCDHCGVILYIKHLKENQRVCFGCGYHLQMNSQERIEHIIDLGSWRPLDETLSPCDPLEFRDQKQYTERLKEAQERTGLQDAIQTGTGMLDGIPVALGVMDFNFMGGSMGSVVGEKITRLIEYATQEGLTLILVCASGGARMQEGILSLMQMAKISAALQVYQSCANLLYISVLTSPTTGGVTASFAMLGDLIFAEPKALIGFAGRRVIEQTLQEQLPDDFQTAEYLLHHGLLDLIVPRSFLKQALSETITLYKDAPFKESGLIPHGIQQNLGFLTEEKVRRKCKNWSKNLELYQTSEKNKSYSFDISKKTIQKNLDFDKNETSLLFSDNKDPQLQGINLVNSLYLSYKESPCDSYYREILLSFQTIFNFFENTTSSKKIYTVSENLADFQFLSFFSKKDNTKEIKKELIDENKSSSSTSTKLTSTANQDLKESEILFQEQQEFNNSISFANSSHELIKNSISRAKSEIIEWRALYLNQNIQPKITFLEYLTTQTEQKNQEIIDKKFFYNYKKPID